MNPHFNEIKSEIEYLANKSSYQKQNVSFIPLSALKGDNVVDASENMDWYKGETLLQHLENLTLDDVEEVSKLRFPIQTVIRPKTEEYHDFRGYAGKVYGGDLAVGDAITVLPSKTTSKIKTLKHRN